MNHVVVIFVNSVIVGVSVIIVYIMIDVLIVERGGNNMPCYDERDSKDCDEAIKQNKKLSAMLCAVLTSLDRRDFPLVDNVIEYIDEEESGITSLEIREWWEKHKREDGR